MSFSLLTTESNKFTHLHFLYRLVRKCIRSVASSEKKKWQLLLLFIDCVSMVMWRIFRLINLRSSTASGGSGHFWGWPRGPGRGSWRRTATPPNQLGGLWSAISSPSGARAEARKPKEFLQCSFLFSSCSCIVVWSLERIDVIMVNVTKKIKNVKNAFWRIKKLINVYHNYT